MLLYLVRHGKAESGDVDAARRLTDGGRKAVGRVARALASAGIRVDRIEHSGLVRAQETAEILADALQAPVTTAAGLEPFANVAAAARRLRDSGIDQVMLVGHQPFTGRMASYLLTGDADVEILHFPTSAVACLSNEEGRWQLEWLVTAKVLSHE